MLITRNIKTLKITDLKRDNLKDLAVVLIDTNFLLSVAELHVDIFTGIDNCVLEKYNLVILDGVLRELNNIIDAGKGKRKGAAKLSKDILEKKDHLFLKGFDESPTADEAILDFISEYRRSIDENKKIYIATQDKELRVRILKNIKNCKFLKIRQKKYVVLD